jgi:hypothetical protein
MAKTKHISIRPSEAEEGGTLGFPVGATVEITEAAWSKWEEAGESALKGGRNADDPVLKLVGEVQGSDVDPITVFLGAGKSTRMQPSDDGEFLEPADESTATALHASCNANIFLESLTDKKKQGKMALPEGNLDDGVSKALVGLKFVVGSKVIERDFQDDEKRAKRGSLVAEEIVALPKGGGKSASKSKTKTTSKKKDEDEDEDEDEGGDVTEAAEKAVLEALGNPKYRKGLPAGKVFNAVFTLVKESDDSDEITKQVEDEEWMQDDARPWVYDSDDEVYKEAK